MRLKGICMCSDCMFWLREFRSFLHHSSFFPQVLVPEDVCVATAGVALVCFPGPERRCRVILPVLSCVFYLSRVHSARVSDPQS